MSSGQAALFAHARAGRKAGLVSRDGDESKTRVSADNLRSCLLFSSHTDEYRFRLASAALVHPYADPGLRVQRGCTVYLEWRARHCVVASAVCSAVQRDPRGSRWASSHFNEAAWASPAYERNTMIVRNPCSVSALRRTSRHIVEHGTPSIWLCGASLCSAVHPPTRQRVPSRVRSVRYASTARVWNALAFGSSVYGLRARGNSEPPRSLARLTTRLRLSMRAS